MRHFWNYLYLILGAGPSALRNAPFSRRALLPFLLVLFLSAAPRPTQSIEPLTTTALVLTGISILLDLTGDVISFWDRGADPIATITVQNREKLDAIHARLDGYDQALVSIAKKLDQLPVQIKKDMVRLYNRTNRNKIRAFSSLLDLDAQLRNRDPEPNRFNPDTVRMGRLMDLQNVRSELFENMTVEESHTIDNMNALLLASIYELSALIEVAGIGNAAIYAKRYITDFQKLLPIAIKMQRFARSHLTVHRNNLEQRFASAKRLWLQEIEGPYKTRDSGRFTVSTGRCGMGWITYAYTKDVFAQNRFIQFIAIVCGQSCVEAVQRESSLWKEFNPDKKPAPEQFISWYRGAFRSRDQMLHEFLYAFHLHTEWVATVNALRGTIQGISAKFNIDFEDKSLDDVGPQEDRQSAEVPGKEHVERYYGLADKWHKKVHLYAKNMPLHKTVVERRAGWRGRICP